MTEEQQADFLRGAKIAAESFGLDRLLQNTVDAIAEIQHKDDLINRLLDKVQRLEHELNQRAVA